MIDWKQYADYYIIRVGGPDDENASHSVIEADDVIIPILIDAFRVDKAY
jgi:hypothetical protein